MEFSSKNTGACSHFLLQRIFLTGGLNPKLLHCRQILSCLSHQGSLLWEESDQTRSLPSRNLHFIARKNKQKYILNLTLGTSLMVQLLRLHTSNSGGAGLIPGWGTKTPQAMHVCKCVCVCVYWKADKKVVIEQPLYHVVSCWKKWIIK